MEDVCELAEAVAAKVAIVLYCFHVVLDAVVFVDESALWPWLGRATMRTVPRGSEVSSEVERRRGRRRVVRSQWAR